MRGTLVESLYCIVLLLSGFLIAYGQKYTLIKQTFTSLSDVNKILNAPVRNVYFLYAENSEHNVPSGKIFLNMCRNLPQNEYQYKLDDNLVDTNGFVLPNAVGTGRYIVLFGGPFAQPCVKYYEEFGEAPLVFRENDTYVWWETKEGDVVKEAFARLEFDEHHDIFVVEFFFDRFGRGVFIAYGYGQWGTLLAGLYFRDVIYPRISEYTKAYYIFKWFDADNNGFPEVNEIVNVSVKYVSIQAVIHRAEIDQNLVEWFANASHSRSLKVTWYVNPANLNETIISLLKSYISLGDDVELSFGSIFFNEMKPEKRLEHVDSYVAAFRNAFGFDPVLVEAYYIDAYTLGYIDSHYPSVKGAVGYVNHEVFCDNFKSAGAYYMPYYPSKYNALVPSNSSEDKLDIVMLPFVHRDITNDILQKSVLYNLNPQDGYHILNDWRIYFKRLLNAFLDGWDQFGLAPYIVDLTYSYIPVDVIEEDLKQIQDSIQLEEASNVLDTEFVEWFRSEFDSSPSYRWIYKDPISESFTSAWYFTPERRVGFIDGQLSEYRKYVHGEYENSYYVVMRPYDNSMPLAS